MFLQRCVLALAVINTGYALKEYNLTVTNGRAAPDGVGREAIFINGVLGGPTIVVEQNEQLNITITNGLDAPGYTGYFGSVTVHWHGLGMNGVPYLDGAAYVSQCPLQRNQTQHVDFAVFEPAGTYFYHSHSSMLAADGLVGAFIVTGSKDEVYKADYGVVDDVVLLVQDWFRENSVVHSKGLNQPFPISADQTGDAHFKWIGTPAALLFNFAGCAKDCTPPVGNATAQTCDPNPDCDTRYVLDVSAATTRNQTTNSTSISPSVRVRMIGAASLVYQIVCFEGHEVTLIETDARSVEPLLLEDGCVDVNIGQRMDVILKLKTEDELREADTTQFWITGRGTGRVGMPASYGVLSYANSTALPTTPPPQPADVRPNWSEDGWGFLNIKHTPAPSWVSSRQPANKTVKFDITQPVLQQTNQIRWALANAVYLTTPSCDSVLDELTSPDHLSNANPRVVSNSSALANVDIYDMPGLGLPGSGSDEAYIFLNLAEDPVTMPEEPVAGSPIVTADPGMVVDIIVQSLPPMSLGGVQLDRTAEEQHPMHLHGQHFYLIGSGQGLYEEWDSEALDNYLNFENPQLRDTATLPKAGWLYLRFKADNLGAWPFHCHILSHEVMGMAALFTTGDEEIPTAPAGSLPECQTSCDYNAKVYGSTEGLPTQQTAETAETASALSAAMPSMSFLGWVLAGGLLLTIAN